MGLRSGEYLGRKKILAPALRMAAAVGLIDLDKALGDAVWHGETRRVQALLAAGADVHARNDSALYRAARNGHSETVKVLLAAGADMAAWDHGAMRLATRNGHSETVQVLERWMTCEPVIAHRECASDRYGD